MKSIFTLLFITLICSASFATKVTATGDGNWDQDASWDGTHPGCYDTICIPAGITITITSSENLNACDTIVFEVYGRLEFQTGKKLDMSCGSDVYVYPGGSVGVGGGGGSSTYIEICNVDYWDASMGDMTGPTVLCGSGACVPLPIELVGFTGFMDDNERLIHLTWTTKSEANNDYFTIEKSIDGIEWVYLNEVDGAGNSSIELDYHLPDSEPYIGINYYRLSQFDFDGASEIFDPIAVINDGTSFDSEMIIIQGEGNNLINIFLKDYQEETVVIDIYNLQGQVVYSKELFINQDGLAVISLDSDLSLGMYVIKASEEIEKTVVK